MASAKLGGKRLHRPHCVSRALTLGRQSNDLTYRLRRQGRRGDLKLGSAETHQSCATFATLRASQVGSCGAAVTSSWKAVHGRLCFRVVSAASAFSGASQARLAAEVPRQPADRPRRVANAGHAEVQPQPIGSGSTVI
jgi:hypothetical protein